jgi:hypothetical protein
VHGWKVGVDGSVVLVTLGVGGSIDTAKITSPIIGFILDPKGLMYNFMLEGSNISHLALTFPLPGFQLDAYEAYTVRRRVGTVDTAFLAFYLRRPPAMIGPSLNL